MARWLNRVGEIALLSCVSTIEPASSEECKRVAAGEGAAIQKYANECFKKLDIDPAEFAKTFNCVDPAVARHLKVEVDGVETKTCFETRDGPCQYAKDLTELQDTFKSCDFPAWLDDRCYGDSYVQVIQTKNSDVKGALLCRHKTRFTGTFDDFDDVAMIVHNRKNGETCWFQSNNADSDPGIKLHGQQVPGPVCEDSESFWMTPEAARGIGCIMCHDSGPWMNSRWMRRASQEIGTARDEEDSPYLNSTPPFDKWPLPLFVKYNEHLDEDGDRTDDEGCTTCHMIAAGRTISAEPTDLEFKTCDTWIKRATGRPDSDLNDLLTDSVGKQEHVQYWMPDFESKTSPTRWTKATWEAKYQKHVDGLIECCKAVGAGPTGAGSTGLPNGCTAFCPDTSDGKCPADRWATP